MQALQSSDLPLAYQLHGSSLVTSLPYIEQPLDKKQYHHIKKMIDAEAEKLVDTDNSLPADLENVIETPFLDKYSSEQLGKRDLKRAEIYSKYELAVLEVEELKEKYTPAY